MTQQMNRAGAGPHRPPGDHVPRLLMKSGVSKTGYVDGAWWPYSDDLTTELPALLAVLATEFGVAHRVVYHLGEWASVPDELVIGGRVVRLDGHRHNAVHTIEVLGVRDRRRVLLVVPPHMDAHHAFAAMTSASDPNNESTVDELLVIGARERGDRTDRATAVQRWKFDSARLLG